MSRRRTLIVVVLMATVPLLGCLGETDLDQTDLPEDPDSPTTGEATASVHTAGTRARAGAAADSSRVLAPGVPLPDGLSLLTGFHAFEPTIGVTSDGALFMSNIQGGELPTDHSSIVRSTDRGHTWEDVTPRIGPVSSPPNSNDPYVYVDEATDRVYNLDMQGLACNYIQWSDDNGQSWTQAPLGCGQPPVLDHPTIFAGRPTALQTVGYENVVYLCVNRVADSACATSLDGGLTWAGFVPVYPGVSADGELCGGLHAHGVTGPDGRAYLPKGQCGTPMVAISDDNGLTWRTVPISDSVPSPGHEVALAVDEGGNVYAFWMSDDRLPYLAVSTDRGETWGKAMRVSPPGVTIARFPTIAAGSNGSVAMAYVGTTSEADQEDMAAEDTWNAYLTTTTQATAEAPVFTTVTANDASDPIARGPCTDRCTPPEGGAIGDFIDVVVDEEGRPWAAFVDVCTRSCATDGGDENDVGIGMVGTLRQGPSLRGGGALPVLGR